MLLYLGVYATCVSYRGAFAPKNDIKVKPEEPKLEISVSGQSREFLSPGDWVLVTCDTRGGYPAPDIGITVNGLPAGSKDFRNLRNSFTFTASQEDDGKRILCTAVNTVGTSVAAAVLNVYSELNI